MYFFKFLLVVLLELPLLVLNDQASLLHAIVACPLPLDSCLQNVQIVLLDQIVFGRALRRLQRIELFLGIRKVVPKGDAAHVTLLQAGVDVGLQLMHLLKVGGAALILTHPILVSGDIVDFKQLLSALVLLLLRDALPVKERRDGLLVDLHLLRDVAVVLVLLRFVLLHSLKPFLSFDAYHAGVHDA